MQQKIQVIRRNQVYFSFSNILTNTKVIAMDQMFNEKFQFCFKTIKWNLIKSYAASLKSAEYKIHLIKGQLLKLMNYKKMNQSLMIKLCS